MQLKQGTELQNGKYRIVRALGQGGFGITYEAEQVNLGRMVALKEFFMKDSCQRIPDSSFVTVPTLSNQEIVEKFRGKFIREAKMIASLDHPHIVRVMDVFEENGTAYYVMDDLKGGSLKDKVRLQGRFSEAEAEDFIRQVADALSYIHSRNMLHLDVKPSNILLNAKGGVVLIDFGVSKRFDKTGEQTSSTPVAVSRGFAPLEQGMDGVVSQFGPSTDIYALGATLYFMVAGETPPDATCVYEDGLPRPDGISDRMWHVIESTMQPHRKNRPQSIDAFLALFDTEASTEEEPEVVIVDEDTVIMGQEPRKEPKEEPQKAPKEEPKAEPKPEPKPKVEQKPPPKPEPKPKPKPERKEKPKPKPLLINGKPLREFLKDNGMSILGILVSCIAVAVVLILLFGGKDKQGSKGAGSSTAVVASAVPITGTINNHEWVDLGLSVKWATCNVGASSPNEGGSLFAWGETTTKKTCTWKNLKYCLDSSGNKFSKYVTNSKFGEVDNETQLDRSDDVARVKWGGTWRMPTFAELQELKDKCTWTWSTQGSKHGYTVTSKINGGSIFIPVAGARSENKLINPSFYGYYWSSSLNTENQNRAFGIYFYDGGIGLLDSGRYIARSVRPVTE